MSSGDGRPNQNGSIECFRWNSCKTIGIGRHRYFVQSIFPNFDRRLATPTHRIANIGELSISQSAVTAGIGAQQLRIAVIDIGSISQSTNFGTNSSFGNDLTGAPIGTVSFSHNAEDKSMTKSSSIVGDRRHRRTGSSAEANGETFVFRSRILRNDNSCGVGAIGMDCADAEPKPTSFGIINFGLIDRFVTAAVAVSTASVELRRKWKLAKSDNLLNVGDTCAVANCNGLPPPANICVRLGKMNFAVETLFVFIKSVKFKSYLIELMMMVSGILWWMCVWSVCVGRCWHRTIIIGVMKEHFNSLTNQIAQV